MKELIGAVALIAAVGYAQQQQHGKTKQQPEKVGSWGIVTSKDAFDDSTSVMAIAFLPA
jgi:hypothetical protein